MTDGKSKKTTPVRLLRDYFAEEDVRTPAGEVVDLPVAEAKRLVESGVALRADPMPEDE